MNINKTPVKFFKQEDLDFIKENAGKMTLSDIAKHLGTKDDWTIGKQLTKMGIKVRKGKRILRPDTEEFKKDLSNPMYSNAALGRKYKVSSGTIKNWRN